MINKETVKKLLWISLFLTGANSVWGQTKIQSTQLQFWPQYQFSGKISNRWSIQADASYRLKDFDKKSQAVIRGGVAYNPSSTVSFAGGYAYFLHFPINPGVTVTRPEQRPWQQITISSEFGKLQIQHRYRLEERFMHNMSKTELQSGYTMNFRMRYQVSFQYPLKGKKIVAGTPYILVADELMVNFGKKIVYNHYDQNRIHLALGYKFSDKLSATLGYMYIYQQRASGNKFENIHVPRLMVHHLIDFRKKEDKE